MYIHVTYNISQKICYATTSRLLRGDDISMSPFSYSFSFTKRQRRQTKVTDLHLISVQMLKSQIFFRNSLIFHENVLKFCVKLTISFRCRLPTQRLREF